MSYRLPIQFTLVLFGALGITFVLHYFLLVHYGFPPLDNLLVASYVTNYVLGAGIFIGLFAARKKLKNAIGFLFMGGSLLKFAVFFIFFYPIYRADGNMQRTEFAAFFIPYFIALVLETFYASKMLNQTSDS